MLLLTLDGVRWQEFFGGADPGLCEAAAAGASPDCARPGPRLFARAHGELAARAMIWGEESTGTSAAVSNDAMFSLPAYQSMQVGAVTPCANNNCGRVGVETLGERMVRELALPRASVATVASWDHLVLAAEHLGGSTSVNAGPHPMIDDDPRVNRGELDALNDRQAREGAVWPGARSDASTMMQALRYLRDHRPRFLFVSLNDADEWGHAGDYARYLSTLRQYDDWIMRLALLLDGMGEYGRATTLLVTTDHGRGDGPRWRDHGGIAAARRIWLVAVPASRTRVPIRTRAVSHIDLRPTIEALVGLTPRRCDGCGTAIPEVVEGGVGLGR